MTNYPTLLALIAPVFAMIAAGMFARWRNWLRPEAEESLLKLVVNLLFPCLVLRSVIGNEALRTAENVVLPPLVGFFTTVAGFVIAYYCGRALGLRRGTGMRTFAFAVGVYNYGYIPIPIVQELFGAQTLGVLFVHNIGCELAVWTVGVVMLAGASWRGAWRRAINPPAISIVLAVALNFARADLVAPEWLMTALGLLGACAVPLGLVTIGGTLFELLAAPQHLVHARVTPVSTLLRLGALPLLFLVAARFLPFSIELKQVMIVQAAMPAGISPLIIARHFGGHPLTAAQVIIGTTVLGLWIIPLWIRFGLAWTGVGG